MSWWINELIGATALGLLVVNVWLLLGSMARRTRTTRSAVLLWFITLGWLASR